MRGDAGAHLLALGFVALAATGLVMTVQGAITAGLLAAFLAAYLLTGDRAGRPVVLLGIGEVVALSTGTEGFPLALQLLLLGLLLRELHLLAGRQSIGLFAAFAVASIGFVAILQAGTNPLATLPVMGAVFGGVVLVVAIVEYRQQKRLAGGL
ncbi:hypothetical protein FGU65_10625 [Methanoculleus sp. FWC-SCC1]|uniref:Uncharacterized protein n=1 Tax=Methanoculleus frigidifontis TaxID=2584085 RepID=A0ABT8MBN5_9EURY|nr:hypothetical protein [Methanoculleus sp. FWC-SCC1]MDN7025341.1 hypothetical protein [Methanoculleus sp. FWC-SCC1]